MAAGWLDAAKKHDLDRIFLVAPSSSDERIALISSACGGTLPVAVGLGVSTGDQAAQVASVAGGVIVGSASGNV